MGIGRVFIIHETGSFRVIPGGKLADEPSDPRGSLYSVDISTQKSQLLSTVDYVTAKLGELRGVISNSSDENIYSICLELKDLASDLNFTAQRILDEE
jgi:hypothetical protein